MAKRKTKSGAQRAGGRLMPDDARLRLRRSALRLTGLLLIAVAAALALSLAGYHPGDPGPFTETAETPRNYLGLPGAMAAEFLLQTLGLAAIALILPLAGWGWRIGSLRGLPWFWSNLLAIPLAALCLALALTTVAPAESWPLSQGYGGFLGQALAGPGAVLSPDRLGAPVWLVAGVAGLLGLLALLAALGLSPGDWAGLARRMAALWRALAWPVRAMLRRRAEASASPRANKHAAGGRGKTAKARGKGAADTESPRVGKPVRPRKGSRDDAERQPPLFPDTNFLQPSLDLLAAPPGRGATETLSTEALEQNARLLESVLREYSISGEIVQVRPGPVVTLYELEPAPGTKSARVIGLAEDIARSMSAVSARISVIPGRNAIGIELPNARRETVALRELLASRDYEKARARLPLVLGKDISGSPVIADLTTMPHLLVAGTTGSGKSVGLNAMILSLLYRLSPEQCRLILVDPKMLELSIYEAIPHLLTPVVTEPKKAVVALKWAVREMEDRYRAMSKIGVRNLAAYNARVAEAQARGESLRRKVQTGFDPDTGQPVYEEQEFDFEPLPMIVIVIDEMADLMLVAGKDVEAVVQRLAQMARAAGIHLIMATQRPSVDVITGTIKANFPTRISFQVTSKIDSRTILGEQGAEQLLGQGDMLYMAGGGRITRVHGAFVTDDEVEKVVAHLRRQAAPSYLQEVTEEPPEGFESPFIPGPSRDDAGNDDSSLYDKAVDVVLRDRRVSTSYIQRRLRIGYNRAASLIEEMEDQGVISAPNMAGKREILVPARDDP